MNVATLSPVLQRSTTFQSAGKDVRLEVYLPAGVQSAPALLLLHGASGLYKIDTYIPQLAGVLAEQGFATVLVRYFDATRTVYADDATIWKEFETWLATIGDAVTEVGQLPEVDGERIGMVGYSLGAYLALALASRDRRVKAVVEFAGGMDATFAKGVQHLPPTLLVHGEADRRVPFDRATELQAVLARLGTQHETRFYPGEGHFFSPAAGLDALEAAVVFLQRHL